MYQQHIECLYKSIIHTIGSHYWNRHHTELLVVRDHLVDRTPHERPVHGADHLTDAANAGRSRS